MNKENPKLAEGKPSQKLKQRPKNKKIEKSNETKSQFFEKINRIDEPVARPIENKTGSPNRQNQKRKRSYSHHYRNTKDHEIITNNTHQ